MNSDTIRQVSSTSARQLDLQPRASVRCSPEALHPSVRFFRDEDEFDTYDAAILRLDPDEELHAHRDPGDRSLTFMVQRYDHEPLDALTIFLPALVVTSGQGDQALERILAALQLSPGVVIAPASSAAMP